VNVNKYNFHILTKMDADERGNHDQKALTKKKKEKDLVLAGASATAVSASASSASQPPLPSQVH